MAGSIALIGAGLLLYLYPGLEGAGAVTRISPWLPSLGLNFSLRLDGISFLFAFLVLGIGALVVLYARYYMSSADPVPRFFSFLLAFMGSMLGVILSGNIIQMAFFWELTSLFSFLLIGYWHHNQSARDGARMSLMVTGAGGVCLLVGLLIIGNIAGSYELVDVIAAASLIKDSPAYAPALILILIGCFTKSAQFPFHFWLPHAMAAPTPVSAYLHSATMVKAGIFVLMRLWPAMAGTDLWYMLVTCTGLATLLLGAWVAIFQQDLKGLLAYSTISHLGLITLLLGLGSPLALVAAVFHTANHATFKASLFMAAGIIDHETGTRDIRRLSGLYKFMPITATLAMVAAAAMAGVPLLNGFLSKEMFLAEALATNSTHAIDQFLPILATAASAFSVLYSLRFIHQSFFGPAPVDLPKTPHEPPIWMLAPIEILVAYCLLVGILPSVTIGPVLDTAVTSLLGEAKPEYSLAVWHGFNMPLLMSMIALLAGTILYLLTKDRLNSAKQSPVVGRLKGRRAFDAVLGAIVDGARVAQSYLGTARLQVQLRLLVLVAFVAGVLPFLLNGFRPLDPVLTPLDPVFAVIWFLGALCAIAAAWQAKFHRLASLILLGGAGLATCLTFAWLSSPDLAVTQLVVEIVTTVLLLLCLRWLPKRRPDIWDDEWMPSKVMMRRGSDLVIAILGGIGMTMLAYFMMTRPATETISNFFMRKAYSDAGGTNVVNVILVDFRSFDTFGEITVLSIVGITVFSLLRRFRPAIESISKPEQQIVQNRYDERQGDRKVGDTLTDYLAIPRLVMAWFFPVIIVFAIYLLMRGHDQPGGGFAAGVVMSIAIVLQYMGLGTRRTEARLVVLPFRWIGFGLLLAGLTGIGAMLFGRPFLTTFFQYTDLPLIGKMPTASALIFDIGVFAVVVGVTVLILIALAHQSIRTSRAGDN